MWNCWIPFELIWSSVRGRTKCLLQKGALYAPYLFWEELVALVMEVSQWATRSWWNPSSHRNPRWSQMLLRAEANNPHFQGWLWLSSLLQWPKKPITGTLFSQACSTYHSLLQSTKVQNPRNATNVERTAVVPGTQRSLLLIIVRPCPTSVHVATLDTHS